jgi:hypothetical protein
MLPSPWWRNLFQCIRLDAQNWINSWWFSKVTLNQDSSVSMMLGYGLADQVLESRQGQRIFGASKTSRMSLGSSRPSIQWVPKFFLQVKAAWAWSWKLPSTAEVRNKWSAQSTPPYALMTCTGTTVILSSLSSSRGHLSWLLLFLQAWTMTVLEVSHNKFPFSPNLYSLF